ncbi:conserved hypothetical protein [Candidatus Terasakiella magnetica]|nr:conserved hypothetical protein [Candidatus Terasakiella magnetica]
MSKAPDFGAVKTSAELLSIARAMELNSVERYRELAEAFEISCNPDTAEAFRELAEDEARQAADFPVPAAGLAQVVPWFEEDPEIADPGAVHYLMHPWHALDLGLRHQERSLALFAALAEQSPFAEVKAEALRLVERERGHVAEITAKRDRLPEPPDDWEDDLDPPNWEAGD